MSGATLLTTTGHHQGEAPVWECLLCGVKAIAADLLKCPGCEGERGAEPAPPKPEATAKPQPPPAPAAGAAKAETAKDATGALSDAKAPEGK
jgi:hypothetical protein